jgi:hypothetical protein
MVGGGTKDSKCWSTRSKQDVTKQDNGLLCDHGGCVIAWEEYRLLPFILGLWEQSDILAGVRTLNNSSPELL